MQIIQWNRVFRLAVIGVALMTGAGLALNTGIVEAQQSSPTTPNRDPIMPPPSQPTAMSSEDPSIGGRIGQDRIEVMKEADRHNHAQKDVEKMVALTHELQAAYARTNQGQLPADLVKKAKEVEKLAHDLQVQMNP